MKNLLLIALCFFGAANIFGQESNSFAPEIKRVAVFKNGYAFTYREGEATTNGNCLHN